MLKRYNDFLLESLITESIVVYSDKFRQILSKIDSPVSKALLDIESKDLDIDKNYIDIAKDKEHFSFIPDNRIRRIMNPSSKFIKFQPSEYVKISWVKVIFEALECDPDYVPNFLGSDIVSMSGRKYIGPVNTNINLYGEVIKEAYVFEAIGDQDQKTEHITRVSVTSNVATIYTATTHPYAEGDVVQMFGLEAANSGLIGTPYTVTSVADDATYFTVETIGISDITVPVAVSGTVIGGYQKDHTSAVSPSGL
ncbi:hypothetical protein EBU71_19730, partial [bacterium]|nr:hypothetical protein [Candidatus Elulimicrobium humile]